MITGSTRLYAVAGYPVKHSLSPAIHNFLFDFYGVDAIYVSLPVVEKNFLPLVKALSLTSFDGINLTTPHKSGFLNTDNSFLDLTEKAKALSAVNTLKKINPDTDRWMGYNTDGAGICDFIELESDFSLSDTAVTIFGTGPAARSAVYELLNRQARVSVINRTRTGFEHNFWKKLIDEDIIQVASANEIERGHSFIDGSTIIINATGFGQGGKVEKNPFFMDLSSALPELVVDMNYSLKNATVFNSIFSDKVCSCNGIGMLRRQAGLAFSIWTDTTIDEAVHKELRNYIDSCIV